MELKNVLNFLRTNSGTSQPSTKTRKTSCVPLKKHVKKSMNLSVTQRATSTPLKTLKLPLPSLNRFRFNSATLATIALCPKRLTWRRSFAEIAQAGMDFETWASVELSFFDDALVEADEDVLNLGATPSPHFLPFVRLKLKKLTIGS